MDAERFNYETARVGEFRRHVVRHVQCRSCGYEPARGHTPGHCPKCGGGCWEKYIQMGKLRADPPAVRAAQLRTPLRVRPVRAAAVESVAD